MPRNHPERQPMTFTATPRSVMSGTAMAAITTLERLLHDLKTLQGVYCKTYKDYQHWRVAIRQIEKILLPQLRNLKTNQLPANVRKWMTSNARHTFIPRTSEFKFNNPTLVAFLEGLTRNARKNEYIQRIIRESQDAHQKRKFIVFDTLTIDPRSAVRFEQDENAIRDYTRSIKQSIITNLGYTRRNAPDDIYSYVCVPELGTRRGRLHYHILHFCKGLPIGATDPNIGRTVRNHTEIKIFKSHWKYGYSTPIAVRYSGDQFTRLGWLAPIDSKYQFKAKDCNGVCFYLVKYIKKNVDERSELECQSKSEKSRMSMTRKLGLKQTIHDLAKMNTTSLIQALNLHHTTSKYSKILKRSASVNLKSRLEQMPALKLWELLPPAMKLISLLQDLMQGGQNLKQLNLEDIGIVKLKITDISNELRTYIRNTEHTWQTFPIGAK